MNVPLALQRINVFERHRALRWVVPAAVLTVLGLAAGGVFTATHSAASKNLPATTPSALVAAVRTPTVAGFSGTVISRVSIGLPDLEILGSSRGAAPGTLLTGSHTLQVWYGGATHQRVALLGTTDETDVFRAGRSVWEWSSAERTALHGRLPRAAERSARSAAVLPSASAPTSVTPSGLADSALDGLDPTTSVRVRHTLVSVADRSAYDLVLTPRSDRTLIGSMHIAIDGATKVPLRVQIYPRGSSDAAVDVGFTSISMTKPAQTNFHFSPPSDARVDSLRDTLTQPLETLTGGRAPRVLGSGWTRVLDLHADRHLGAKVLHRAGIGRVFTAVHGSWGHGQLLQSKLLSVLVTHDGHIFAGAVTPAVLYADAARR